MTDLAQHAVIVDAQIMVEMRDGVRLATDIYRPDRAGTFGVLVVRTPYDTSMVPAMFNLDALVSAGYVIVVQSCRGTQRSEGIFEPFRHEGADGYDTIEWAAEQSWSNGRVATIGASYLAIAQWAAAVVKPPHLVAMVPASAPATFFDGFPYARPGVLALETAVSWTVSMARDLMHRSGVIERPLSEFPGLAELAAAEFGLPEAEGAVERGRTLLDDLYGHRPLCDIQPLASVANWYSEWMSHQSLGDEYWQDFAPANHYSSIEIPVMHVTGWYDAFLQATIQNFHGMLSQAPSERARETQRLVIGPWDHTQVALGTSGNPLEAMLANPPVPPERFELLLWLDSVMGEPDPATPQPRVLIYVMGDNVWREESEWPLSRARPTSYFLRGGSAEDVVQETLSTAAPTSTEVPDTYTYDPQDPVPSLGGACISPVRSAGPADQRPNEDRRDVLVYTSALLSEPMEVTGSVTVELWAATTAPDTDFTIQLIDVHPDGTAVGLSDGLVRASTQRSERPCPAPGQPELFSVELPPTSNVFGEGHRIRLHISSSNYPKYDANPNTGTPLTSESSDVLVANQAVFHDIDHPSRIVLPVIPR